MENHNNFFFLFLRFTKNRWCCCGQINKNTVIVKEKKSSKWLCTDCECGSSVAGFHFLFIAKDIYNWTTNCIFNGNAWRRMVRLDQAELYLCLYLNILIGKNNNTAILETMHRFLALHRYAWKWKIGWKLLYFIYPYMLTVNAYLLRTNATCATALINGNDPLKCWIFSCILFFFSFFFFSGFMRHTQTNMSFNRINILVHHTAGQRMKLGVAWSQRATKIVSLLVRRSFMNSPRRIECCVGHVGIVESVCVCVFSLDWVDDRLWNMKVEDKTPTQTHTQYV